MVSEFRPSPTRGVTQPFDGHAGIWHDKPVKKTAVLLLLLSVWGCRAPARYNTVLIGIDTLRRDHVGTYDPARAGLTPHMDALLAESQVFTRASTVVPFTLPSFTSAFTGIYPYRHGVHHNIGFTIPEDIDFLPARLARSGFHTIGVPSGVPLAAGKGFERGFASYHDAFLRRPGGGNPLYRPLTAEQAALERSHRPAMDSVLIAVEALHAAPKGPWMLFLHLFDPHFPYQPPEPFASRHPDDPYAGEVAYTDEAVGALVAALKHQGLYDEALIVLWSDHGEGLGEHGEDQHGYYLYDTTIAVPLGVKLPASLGRRHPPRRLDAPATLMDIFPTVCGILGLPAPGGVDGRDLWPLIQGRTALPETPMFLESEYPHISHGWEKMYGLIVEPRKIVVSSEPQVFDRAADPAEATNLHPEGYDALWRRARPFLQEAERAGAAARPVSEGARALMSLGYVAPGGGSTPAKPLPPSQWPAVMGVYDRGYALIAEGKPAQARALYDAFLRDHPDDFKMLLMRGYALMVEGSLGPAIADLEHALLLNPDAIEGYELLMQAHRRRGEEARYSALLAVAEKRFPPGTFLRHRVEALVTGGRTDEALDLLRRARETHPLLPYPILATLDLLIQSQRVEEAKACAAAPPHRERLPIIALYFDGMTHYLEGRLPEALETLQQACEAGADFPEPYLYAGILLKGARDFPAAAARLNAATLLGPASPQAFYERSDALAGAGDLEGALEGFLQTLLLDPRNPKVHLAVMKTAWLLERFDRAQEAYDWLVHQAPDFLRLAQQQDALVQRITM